MLPHGVKLKSANSAIDAPSFGSMLNRAQGKSVSPQDQANGNTLSNPEGFNLFENALSPVKKNSSKSAADDLKPGSGGGSINVIKEYRWSPTVLGAAAIEEIPCIQLTEYKYGQNGFDIMLQKIRASNTVNVMEKQDPYESLYSYDSPTDFIYTLPFFTDSYYDLSTNFKDANISLDAIAGAFSKNIGGVGKKGAQIAAGIDIARGVATGIEGVAEGLQKLTNPAGGTGKLDIPKIWDSTSPRKVSFKFYLYNTYDYRDIAKNWELVYLLRYQNTINKQSLTNATPPVFYVVNIPGQHFSPAAWIDSLRINNIGTTRKFAAKSLKLPQSGDVHIPDAYSIEISMTDMVMPSQNLLNRMKTNSVTVARKNNTTINPIEPTKSSFVPTTGGADANF